MTRIEINEEENIEITSQFKESVKGWVRSYDYNNRFVVCVKTNDNQEVSFDYTISIDETLKGKMVLTDNDHICAFNSFIGDVMSGTYDFEEFQNEYGYTDCKEAYKIHKLCKESLNKFVELNLNIGLYDLSDLLQEKYSDVI